MVLTLTILDPAYSTACSIVRCQRTAKREAVLYLSDINPIQLMAKERCQTFQEHHLTKQERQARKTERMRERERLRNELFSNLSEKHRTLLGEGVHPITEAWRSYASTHFLLDTGFLIDRNRSECPECGEISERASVHLLFKCPAWDRARQQDLTSANLNNQADLTEIFVNEPKAISFNKFCTYLWKQVKLTENSN